MEMTKEEAIDLYIKMVKSKNSEFTGGYGMLYAGRKIIATADLVPARVEIPLPHELQNGAILKHIPNTLRIANCQFELTRYELDKLQKEVENYYNSITKQDILDAL